MATFSLMLKTTERCYFAWNYSSHDMSLARSFIDSFIHSFMSLLLNLLVYAESTTSITVCPISIRLVGLLKAFLLHPVTTTPWTSYQSCL